MSQSVRLSVIETMTNLLTGFVISVLITHYWMGYTTTNSIKITAVFFVASAIRLYMVRRFFANLKDQS